MVRVLSVMLVLVLTTSLLGHRIDGMHPVLEEYVLRLAHYVHNDRNGVFTRLPGEMGKEHRLRIVDLLRANLKDVEQAIEGGGRMDSMEMCLTECGAMILYLREENR